MRPNTYNERRKTNSNNMKMKMKMLENGNSRR